MANRYIKGITYILMCLVVTACGNKSFDTSEELQSYLNDSENGYHLTKNINGLEYSLMYRPTDLLVQQELGESYNRDDVERLRKKYDSYLYFNLGMNAKGQELLNSKARNQEEFGAMVNQLVFGMGEKVNLISHKKDTLPLVDYVYPRMYGMSQSTNILLVYEKRNLNGKHLRLTVGDMGFGTGEIAFMLNTKAIKEQPKLKL